jgi:Ser/Thr protein kinase RdoA (MazF antagonist)
VETTERAVRAALAVGRAQGLDAREPRVLRDLTNVLVHLAPVPVVARIPITLARLRPPAWFAQEVELASFLARAGAPVAPPAAAVDPGPHHHDGFVVSLWAYVDHDPDRFDPAAVGTALRDLHDALAGYREPLPGCERLHEIGTLLEQLRPSDLVSADDLAGLRRLHGRLASSPLPAGRPLHGDSHFNNVLWGPDGPLWSDLENACSGPVEYDLACLAWRDFPGTADALAAYGTFDEPLLDGTVPFLALFLAAWTVVVVSRVPTEGGVGEARRRIARALAHLEEL